nr:hypothetical protein [Mycobacterium sp.]
MHGGALGGHVVIPGGVVGQQLGDLGGSVVGGRQQPGAGGDVAFQPAAPGQETGDEAADRGESGRGVGDGGGVAQRRVSAGAGPVDPGG